MFLVSKLEVLDSKLEVLDSKLEALDSNLDTRNFRVSRIEDRVESFEFRGTVNLHLPGTVGKDEKTKVKLFLYIIGTKGREIYETLHFEREPNERTLEDVIGAFGEHCNPKKNETVE